MMAKTNKTQRWAIDKAIEHGKQNMLSYMPERIQCVFEHALSQMDFDSVENAEQALIAVHCIGIGVLHGLHAGLCQALTVEGKGPSAISIRLELFDILKDDAAESLYQMSEHQIREQAKNG